MDADDRKKDAGATPTRRAITPAGVAALLVDEFSVSAGDLVPAVFQDNRRGPIVGKRTNGMGGAVISWTNAAPFSEGNTRVTVSMMSRKDPVSVSGYPVTMYVENVGVGPDINLDYMTADNLLKGGQPFVDAFTQLINDLISATP